MMATDVNNTIAAKNELIDKLMDRISVMGSMLSDVPRWIPCPNWGPQAGGNYSACGKCEYCKARDQYETWGYIVDDVLSRKGGSKE